MLNLQDIAEGRALLARSNAGEPGAREALGAWFEAWGGLVLDMFEQIHAPLVHPKRRFCPECGNRSFWPHTSWCSIGAEPPDGATVAARATDRFVSQRDALERVVKRACGSDASRSRLREALGLDEPLDDG